MSVPSALSMKLLHGLSQCLIELRSQLDVDIADILPLREIGSEQGLDHRILHTSSCASQIRRCALKVLGVRAMKS